MTSSAPHSDETSEPTLWPLEPRPLALLSAVLVSDPLAHSGLATLHAALYAPCFGYGLYQAISVYGPRLAPTAGRPLYPSITTPGRTHRSWSP